MPRWTSGEVSSLSRNAGSVQIRHGVPSFICCGLEKPDLSHLAHNQEVTGLNPVSATNKIYSTEPERGAWAGLLIRG